MSGGEAVPTVDEAFLGLPLDAIADAALSVARKEGASHAEVRVGRTRDASIRIRDRSLEGAAEEETSGLSVRVLREGTWGFAATTELTAEAAARAAGEAIDVARTSEPLNHERVELSPEPAHRSTWVSAYEVDPFAVDPTDRVALLTEWTSRLLADPRVDHADAGLLAVRENKFYADLAGARTVQQRVRVHPTATAIAVDAGTGAFESMRTLAPPAGRGLGVSRRRRLELGPRAGRNPRTAGRKDRRPLCRSGPIRPGHRSIQPLAHHSRVHRARHRARPGARLRGGVRRHVVRHVRPAGHPEVRIADHARHRRPHSGTRVGHYRL